MHYCGVTVSGDLLSKIDRIIITVIIIRGFKGFIVSENNRTARLMNWLEERDLQHHEVHFNKNNGVTRDD